MTEHYSAHQRVGAALLGMFTLLSLEAVSALAEAAEKSATASTVLSVTVLPTPLALQATAKGLGVKAANSQGFKLCYQSNAALSGSPSTSSAANAFACQAATDESQALAQFPTNSSGAHTVLHVSY